MKLKFSALLLLSAIILSVTACAGGSNETEKKAKTKMQEGIKYYSDEFVDKIPKVSEEKDREKMIKELDAAISKSNKYVELYMSYMDNEELSKEYQEAAMNLKTAYYGIQTTALEPILEIIKTDSGESPDYSSLVFNAKETYVDKAEELIK